ncbi:ABC transporter substrate-binding protein [Arthrobacter sp. D3-16]
MTQFSKFAATAAAATLLLSLTACTGSTAESTQDTNTVRYLVEQPEEAATLELLKGQIAKFEADSGITVELEAMPQENMRTVLQTQLQSGEGPDVFSWGSGPGYAGALAEAGLLYDLTDAYKQNEWPVYDFAKERVTFDGKIVGVPGDMETLGLFYNKDIFADLGIPEPKNLADVEAAAKKINDSGSGVLPIGVSDQEGWQGGHLLSMALSSRVGSDGMNALLKGDQSWASPDVVAALSVWEDFHASGFIPEFPTSLSYDSVNALFYSGKAAMLPTGSWLVSGIEENTDFEVGYIPFPAEGGSGSFAGGLGSGPYISATSKNPEAAIKFVDFLVSPEHGRWTVENLGTIPSYPVETNGLNVSPLFAQVLEDTSKFSSGESDIGQSIDVLASDVFNEAMWSGIQGILSGQKTAEEVAQDLEAAFRK